MKKIFIIIAGILLCANLIVAQSPVNRTNKTIVADVLAQMPAQEQETYNKMMADLVSTGEEGILMLIDMINAPGQGSNSQVEYALSGLSHYVSEKGQETARKNVVSAYIKAMEKAEEREIKALLIRQLQITGCDESVDALGGLLNGESYSGPAARALAAIGTEKAKDALQVSLMRRMGTAKTQKDAILAIGEAKLPIGEDLILGMVGAGDIEMQRVVLYTLSRIGTKASLKALADAADKVGYKYDKSQANESYIIFLKHLAEQGNVKEAQKAANDLLKKATKVKQTETRIAALEILFSTDKDKAAKTLLTALKDSNKEYRSAAFRFASCYADAPMYQDVYKQMAKTKEPELKKEMIDWLGREATCPQKNDLLKNLDLRFDLPARTVLTQQLLNDNLDVVKATAQTMAKIGHVDFVNPLTELLTSKNNDVVTIVKEALATFPGDIDTAVSRIVTRAEDSGKVAGLQLLALRKATPTINTVLGLVKSDSPVVKETALATLKDVVLEKDFTLIAGMLESSDASAITPLQQALTASLMSQKPEERVNTLTRRMIQAGEAKKYLYYPTLATTGQPEALQTIVTGFANGKGTAKDVAFDALLGWSGIEVIDEFYAIASDPSAQVYHDRALSAYIRLLSNPSITKENRLLGLRKAMDIAKTDDQKNMILSHVQQTGTFLGLVFAGNYMDEKPLQQSAAQAVMNIAFSNKSYTGEIVKNLLTKAIKILDNPNMDYQRQAIYNHLNKMPEEEGFVSLFNGKDLAGWKGLVENPYARAKMSSTQLAKAQKKADEQMHKDWKVEDGCIVFDGTGFDNLCTEKLYGDFEMYIDWKLDSSSPDADAGIYLRGTPQVQMWDLSRVNVGAQVGSGGLYNNAVHQSIPTKVADNKMDEWNSFYIKMVGDRVTVILNGEKVVDNVILENYWNRNEPIFPIEQIELQAHGSKVYYRDIYIKELPRTEPFQLSAEEKKEGFKVLFDGTNMYSWIGNTVDYMMEDGMISLVPSRGSGGNLYTKDEYGNFIFRFEFQLTPAANNGLGIRTSMEGDAAYAGMELQILDNEHQVYKDLEKYQYHGSVYGIIPAKRGFLKPVGEWNYQEVIANGDHIKVTLNGEVILDGNIREATKNGTPDKREHPGLFNKKGHIGFLGHGSPVKFRNIRIKELK